MYIYIYILSGRSCMSSKAGGGPCKSFIPAGLCAASPWLETAVIVIRYIIVLCRPFSSYYGRSYDAAHCSRVQSMAFAFAQQHLQHNVPAEAWRQQRAESEAGVVIFYSHTGFVMHPMTPPYIVYSAASRCFGSEATSSRNTQKWGC